MRINRNILCWICENGYPMERQIADILMANFPAYGDVHAPSVIDVWQWLWDNDCYISINCSWTTGTSGLINSIAVAKYESSQSYFCATADTIQQALFSILDQMAVSYDSNTLIRGHQRLTDNQIK